MVVSEDYRDYEEEDPLPEEEPFEEDDVREVITMIKHKSKPKPKPKPTPPTPIVARLKEIELVAMVAKSQKLQLEMEKDIATHLHQAFADKGYAPNIINRLTVDAFLGKMFASWVLRSNALQARIIENAIRATGMPLKPMRSQYSGSEAENEMIDRAISNGNNLTSSERRFVAGYGATRLFLKDIDAIPALNFTPAIIIGSGPAGVMIARGLIFLGFAKEKITILDKAGIYGGIWQQNNVRDGTINSPFEINFENNVKISPAPNSGSKILSALDQIVAGRYFSLPSPIKATVTGVIPGDLHHTVKYLNDAGEDQIMTAPIVINAIGVGKPLNPNHKEHMQTPTPQEAGIRWQMQIATNGAAEKYKDKMVFLIGLGNSTAEMLLQISRLNKQGYNIDYRVLTHYPAEAVRHPDQTVKFAKKTYRVFRDLSEPNLSKYEGDLKEPKDVYFEALNDDNIISDVTYWRVHKKKKTGENMIIVRNRYGEVETTRYDYLYTLIGYGHDPEEMRAMGMKVTDEYRGHVATDYDGEVQKPVPTSFWNTGRDRIFPGYFALGAVAATDRNRNAETIPGIMHRMYDMLFSIAIRASEYQTNVSH